MPGFQPFMLKKVFKGKSSDSQLGEYRQRGDAMGVYKLVLLNVEDPFDPDPLWDRKYGGGASIVEETSGDEDFRLQAALDGCRDLTYVRDEAGRFREQTPVFTDVVVWLAESIWRADAQHAGHRLEALANNLSSLHSRKFARSLPGNREPIYTIMADEDLPEDRVVFHFGRGVFVPNEEDDLLGDIRMRRSLEEDPVAMPEWSFWRKGAQRKRPVGVYRGQGSILIANDDSVPIRAPLWFGKERGYISLNLSAADSERMYPSDENVKLTETVTPMLEGEPIQWVLTDQEDEGDDASLVIEVDFLAEAQTTRVQIEEEPEPEPEPDFELDLGEEEPATEVGPKLGPPSANGTEEATEKGPRVDRTGDMTAPTAIRREAETERPTDSGPRKSPPVPGTREGQTEFSAERLKAIEEEKRMRAEVTAPTAGPGASGGLERFFLETDRSAHNRSTPLSANHTLRLTGLALLRIDGDRRLPGLDEWAIWFDKNGAPIRDEDMSGTDLDRALAIAGTAQSKELYYRLPGEGRFSQVKVIPCSLTTASGGYVDLHKSPAPDVYHGILDLPSAQSFPLSSQPLLLGRSDSNPKAEQPDLPMELLDHSQGLRWSDSAAARGARLNTLNLSRRHVAVRLVSGRLEVSLAEGRTPVYILGRQGELLKELPPGTREMLMLEPGERFMVGSYILTFHEDMPKTMISRDVSVRLGAVPAAVG